MDILDRIESRFCRVTGYKGKLSLYPLHKSGGFATDKNKSRDFAEVFTPPHIVDNMLESIPNLNSSSKNLDLCAGHGQFTIRMLRKFSKEKDFNIAKYLRTKNFFAELQLESCYKLLWIFGTGINLAIGDALQLKCLPYNWKGIWLYVDKAGVWVNITQIVKFEIKFPNFENNFVSMVEFLKNKLNNIVKDPNMELEKLANIPAGRELLKDWVREVAKDVEDNWQNVRTPEDIAQDMVRCIPNLKTLSRFLVLFNIELLDALIKEGVHISKITYASDSLLEQAMAEGLYKRLKTIPIGRTFDEMKKALESKTGQYDVVLSNPPYQIMDGGGGLGTSASPIYHEIVMYTIDQLKPQYVCIITPSRWMAGGRGLDNYRARMLNDKHIRLIQDFPNATGENAVFDANIPGGVSYFLWERDRDPKEVLCSFNGIDRDISEFDVLVRNNTSAQILKRVLAKHNGKTFCDKVVLSSRPFGMRTFFSDWVPDGTPGAMRCYTRRRIIKYVAETSIAKNPCLKWRIFGAVAPGHNGEIFSNEKDNLGYRNVFLDSDTVCTETYLILGSFGTKKEAENYYIYTQTKFFQFMLSLRVISHIITRKCFSWVPDLGGYANPVTDKDLYAHFNLTKNEIKHIESTIK
jgi:hypothetical protein